MDIFKGIGGVFGDLLGVNEEEEKVNVQPVLQEREVDPLEQQRQREREALEEFLNRDMRLARNLEKDAAPIDQEER